MLNAYTCPICLNSNGKRCILALDGDARIQHLVKHIKVIKCVICGDFTATSSGEIAMRNLSADYSDEKRASISHKLKVDVRKGSQIFIIGDDESSEFSKVEFPSNIKCSTVSYLWRNAKIPNYEDQINSVLSYIGNEVAYRGESLDVLPIDFHSIIGTKNSNLAAKLLEELKQNKYIVYDPDFRNVNLKRKGWKEIGR